MMEIIQVMKLLSKSSIMLNHKLDRKLIGIKRRRLSKLNSNRRKKINRKPLKMKNKKIKKKKKKL
jgi:hypothetical protein